jgi:LPS sulfotransferase NodH
MTAETEAMEPRRERAQATRFVIFAAARTGSNYLCSLLNSHPQVLCHHGLFNPGGIHAALDHRPDDLGLGTVEERDRDPAAFLGRVWRHDAGNTAVGFKFNRGENPTAVDMVLHESGILKILLTRHNRIKTYVSERIAEESGQWESYRGAVFVPVNKVRVEPAELLQHVQRNLLYYAGLERVLRATGQTWLGVHYESLNPDHMNGDVARILSFLGILPPESEMPPLAADVFKRNPDDLRALIANFEELQLELAGAELEGDLYDRESTRMQTCVKG